MAKRLPDWIGPAAATLLPILLGAAAIWFQPAPVGTLRDLVYDAFQKSAPRRYDPAAPVRVIDIDEDSLARYGQWPWPRDRLAAAVRRLHGLGAAVVGLDIMLVEPDRSSPRRVLADVPEGPAKDQVLRSLGGSLDHDEDLAASLREAPSVIGLMMSDEGPPVSHVKATFARLGDPPQLFLHDYRGALQPLPELAQAAHGLGAFNWILGRDLVVRRVPLLLASDQQIVPSFALECLRVLLGARTVEVKSSNASGETAFGQKVGIVALKMAGEKGSVVIRTDGDGSVRVHFAGTRPERRIPFWRLAEGQVAPAEVAGRIALIGSSAANLNDVRATALEAATPGIDVHAEVIEQVLTGVEIVRPLIAPAFEILVLILGCMAAGAAARMRPVVAAVVVLGLVALPVALAWLGFRVLGMVFDPTVPFLAMLATYVGSTLVVYRSTESERRAIREAFSHYVAPEIVDRLASEPGSLRLGGETKDVTVLFCDMRNFTSTAETMTAQNVVRFLNSLHTPLTMAVLERRGTIDKYLGDGLMAFWNAPLDDPDHVGNACRAALAMLASVPAIQRENRALFGDKPVEIGIGLHTGVACVGNLGSAIRFDYSIVGDAVNVAARLEPQSKAFGVPIIVSQAVVHAAPSFAFVPLGDATLRGKSEPVEVHALHGGPEAVTADFSAFLESHRAALAAFRSHSADLADCVAEVRRRPQALPYARLYAGWLARAQEAKPAVTA